LEYWQRRIFFEPGIYRGSGASIENRAAVRLDAPRVLASGAQPDAVFLEACIFFFLR